MILFYFLSLSIISLVAFYGAMNAMFTNLVVQITAIKYPTDLLKQAINDEKKFMLLLFFVNAGFMLISMLIGGLYLSHQVAGPLHRLQEHMKRIISGNIPTQALHFKSRKNDFFPELFEQFNGFVDFFQGDKKS